MTFDFRPYCRFIIRMRAHAQINIIKKSQIILMSCSSKKRVLSLFFVRSYVFSRINYTGITVRVLITTSHFFTKKTNYTRNSLTHSTSSNFSDLFSIVFIAVFYFILFFIIRLRRVSNIILCTILCVVCDEHFSWD